MKRAISFALLVVGPMLQAGFAQQRVFDWVADTNEVVRLAPGMREKTHLYSPGQGGEIKLQLTAQRPVTVGLVHRSDWDNAAQDPEGILRAEVMDRLQFLCVQQHVLNTTYTCTLPA